LACGFAVEAGGATERITSTRSIAHTLSTNSEYARKVRCDSGFGRTGGLRTRRLRRRAVVAMVKPVDFWNRDDASSGRRLDRSWSRRVLAESEVRPRAHVVGHVVSQHELEPRGTEHDHVIEAPTSDGANEALDVAVLPGRSRRREDLLDPSPQSWARRPRRPYHGRGARTVAPDLLERRWGAVAPTTPQLDGR
jgi:hypothetical protein